MIRTLLNRIKREKKILLVNPHSYNINTSPPLSLAYLGAQLKKFGYIVKAIDASAPYNNPSDEGIIKQIEAYQPDVVGVTIMTPFAKEAYNLIYKIKNLGLKLIAGGPHVTILPDEALQKGVDIAIRGEGEITIIELLNAHFSGKGLNDVKGISYKVDQKIVHNQDREYIKDIDVLPYPDKELFDPHWYHKDGIPINEAFGTILTSRGCPGRCTFCSRAVYQNRVRYNSAEYVIGQMQELEERYGTNRFYFLDDNFVTNKKRLKLICMLIKVNFPGITWAITCRVDSVDMEALKWMKDAGCTTITYGLESGSDNNLKRINKRLTADQIRLTVKMSHDLGFDVCANWMLGYPFESVEDVEATKKLVIELDQYIAMHNAGFLIPFPGTELYEEYKYLDSVKEYWLK